MPPRFSDPVGRNGGPPSEGHAAHPDLPPEAGPLADPARLHLLAATGLLGGGAAARLPTLDRLARLAGRATRSPVAQVNLVHADAQVPVAAFVAADAPGRGGTRLDAADAEPGGALRSPVGLDASICRLVVEAGVPLVVADTLADPRTATNRAVTEGGVRAYAAAPLRAPSGHVLGTVCVIDFRPRAWSADEVAVLEECVALAGEEVAARLGAARALSEAHATLDAVMEHLPEGLTLASAPDVTIQRVSRYGRELTGRPLAALVGIEAEVHPEQWQVYHPDGVRLATAEELPLTRATRLGEVVRNEEWVLRRPDGTRTTVLCNAGPIRNADGAITGGLIAWRDIDERKASEMALRRMQAFSEVLSASAGLADVGRAIVREAQDALGAQAAAVVRLRPDDPGTIEILDSAGFMVPALAAWQRFPASAAAPVADTLRLGTPILTVGIEALRARYPDVLPLAEETGYVSWLAIPCLLGDAQGQRAVGALGLAFRGERTLTVGEEELLLAFGRQAAQALERARLFEAEQLARREAEEASRAKGQFLANMSHELRTPLNAIQGHVQLVEMGLHGPVTAAQREALARVQGAGRHLLGLITDVLNYAKLEAGKLEYAIDEVDLRTVIEVALPLVEPQRLEKALRLEWTRPAEALRVWADADKTAQILLNLLGNAVKFTGGGGRIVVTAGPSRTHADDVEVEVSDTGIGIPAGRLESIFEPFVQVNTALTRTQAGTGLGLAISRDLARGMGGELTAESVEGEGARFRLRLRGVVTAGGTRADRRFRQERRDLPDRRRPEGRRRGS